MQSISIVLCTFNGERFLEDQMQSLRVQEGVAEIVVLDDGSTDETWPILQRHAAQDARISINRNPVRLGVNRNFEHAIRLARSSWIALADQDDVWLPGKLARLRADWDERSCLVHHATHKFCGRVPESLPSPAGERRKFSGSNLKRLLYRNSIVGHTTLVRAELVRRLMPFPLDVPYDWWIGAGAAAAGEVQYVDEFLVHYRIHENNAYHPSGSRLRRLRAEHDLRLNLLRALVESDQLSNEQRGFVSDYGNRLLRSRRGTISWPLLWFYLKHATLLFAGARTARLPWLTRLRKSLGATVAAMVQVPHPVALARPRRHALNLPVAAGDTLRPTG